MPNPPFSGLSEYPDMQKAMYELSFKNRMSCVQDGQTQVHLPPRILYIAHSHNSGSGTEYRFCNFTCGEGPSACCYHRVQGTSRAVPCLGVGDRIFLYTVGRKCPGLFYCKFPNMTLKEAVDLFVEYISDKI